MQIGFRACVISNNQEMDLGDYYPDEYSKYYFYFQIHIHMIDFETYNIIKEDVAIVKGKLFNQVAMINDGYDIFDIGDVIDGDSSIYCEILRSEFLEKDEVEEDELEWCMVDSFSGCIDTLYIKKEYRRNGIAKYILNDLNIILKKALNVNVKYIIIFPKPQDHESEQVVNIEDNDMKRLMVDVIKKYGFNLVYKDMDTLEEFYVKKYKLL